jgi:hypothetical protein
MVDHKNIIQLKDYFDEDKALCLVLELATGGDIVEKVLNILLSPSGEKKENSTWQNLVAFQLSRPKNIIFFSGSGPHDPFHSPRKRRYTKLGTVL